MSESTHNFLVISGTMLSLFALLWLIASLKKEAREMAGFALVCLLIVVVFWFISVLIAVSAGWLK